jgi:hypothetical protein
MLSLLLDQSNIMFFSSLSKSNLILKNGYTSNSCSVNIHIITTTYTRSNLGPCYFIDPIMLQCMSVITMHHHYTTVNEDISDG